MMELTLFNEFHNINCSTTRWARVVFEHYGIPIVKLLHEVKNNEEDTIF